MEALREKHTALSPEAAPQSHKQHCNAGPDREKLCKVQEQLVSKKIAERLPVSMAAEEAGGH